MLPNPSCISTRGVAVYHMYRESYIVKAVTEINLQEYLVRTINNQSYAIRQKTKDEQAECPCPAGMLSSFTSCEDDILVSWRYLCERSRAVELEGTSVACAAHSVRLMPSLSLFWTVMTLTVCHTCLFAFFLLSSLSCTVGSLELHVCGSRQEHRV